MAKNIWIGTSVKRVEDKRFITGKGRYSDDIKFPNQSYVYFLRSQVANAKINSVQISNAQKAPGVIAILTAEDFAEKGGLPCGWQVIGKNDEAMREPKHPILADGYVRHVGEPIVGVIAESYHQARDAAELIELDLEILPAVADVRKALAPGAPKVFADLPDNLCFDWELGPEAEVDAALAKSDQVIELELINNRLVANPIEPRSATGIYEVNTDNYTLYTSSQNPHVIRLLMGAFVLSIPEHKLRVVAPDVGGGFGAKIYHYAEEAFVTVAAAKVGRPVKWTADRSEAFVSDAQGRDHFTKAKLGVSKDGIFQALKVDTIANMGAYLSTFAPAIPTYLYATLLAGQYRTPLVYANVRAVFTNTVAVDAYRGAGRPEATSVLEGIVDEAAHVLQMDPTELRVKNFIGKDQFPYQTPVALEYDTGDFLPLLETAKQRSKYSTFADRRKLSQQNGKLRGIGVCTYIEACGIAPSSLVGALGARAGLYEAATIRVNPTGSVTVLTGSHSHGQGHETTFAQVVAEKLGIDMANVHIEHGDTARIPFGMGTYGSRSLAVGASAIHNGIEKILQKAKKIAAHMLEAAEADVNFENGNFVVAGSDKSLSFGDVALSAYVPHNYPHDQLEPGLEETSFYDPKNFTFPAGAYICEVEIDPATGELQVVNFTAADDFGNVVNPMIVDGQVHGGLAQGIGQALLEQCVYDDDGQLITASYMDYTMPRADNFPSFTVDHSNYTPCTHNPLGVKGCGEAGAIGSPAALKSAVLNALRPLGVKQIEMPLTAYNIWQAINSVKGSSNA